MPHRAMVHLRMVNRLRLFVTMIHPRMIHLAVIHLRFRFRCGGNLMSAMIHLAMILRHKRGCRGRCRQ